VSPCSESACPCILETTTATKDWLNFTSDGQKRGKKLQKEVAEYVGKAEGIINEGLRVVRVRDALYIESSNIQQLIGDEPSYLRALENAVRVNDASVVARYLLGRAYRKTGRYNDAITVLEYVIKNFIDEFRCFIEYGLCLIYRKEPYTNAIAVMSLSTLYGFSDPRFLATLGGMYFLNQQFDEATRIFNETGRRNFTANELNTIQFIPPDPHDISQELRFTGSCIKIKPGYSLVETPGYPPFLLPGSKYDGMVIHEGVKMSFVPAFTARGNIAHRPLPL